MALTKCKECGHDVSTTASMCPNCGALDFLSEEAKQAFIIMQIGNSELDAVCEKAIVPALESCGLQAKRVDKHSTGRLLKSEIVGFIESSDIIIADLTNERPNCYLEIGYAMGLDKFRNLILTAQENHDSSSPNHNQNGPKIHFDLSGYQILFWDPNDLDEFRNELEKLVKRRLATITPSTPLPLWDEEWISEHQESAFSGLEASGKSGFMEIRMTVPGSPLNVSQQELIGAAERAQIMTFGWPLAVIINRDDFRPRPRADGIVAEINAEGTGHYDYWTIRKDGTFYLLKDLFEDENSPQHIFFNTRIVRITEALLYAMRLYSRLGVSQDSSISMGIRHGGLEGRTLSASVPGRRNRLHRRECMENEVYTEVEIVLERIEPDLIDLVRSFTEPLFTIFDFFELSEDILAEIVDSYVEGRIV